MLGWGVFLLGLRLQSNPFMLNSGSDVLVASNYPVRSNLVSEHSRCVLQLALQVSHVSPPSFYFVWFLVRCSFFSVASLGLWLYVVALAQGVCTTCVLTCLPPSAYHMLLIQKYLTLIFRSSNRYTH